MSKRIIYITLSVLGAMCFLTAACTSEQVPEMARSQEEMTFEVASPTRVVATTEQNIKDKPFMLFGDVNLGGNDLKTIFDWHSVKFKDAKNWDYGDAKQYWFMGQEHSFVAIHPFIEEDDPQVKILEYKNSVLSFTYKLPEKLEKASDLLFATHRRKYTLQNTGPVSLQFTHLLARIDISMALSENEEMYDHVEEGTKENPYNKNEYIKVHSVEFQGIKTTGAFTFTPQSLAAGSNSTYDYDLTYMIEKDIIEDIVVTLTDAVKVPNSYKEGEEKLKYVSALKGLKGDKTGDKTGDEIVVMLPQSFGADSDSKIVINYSINDDVDLMNRIVIPLKNTVWKEGTVYTYEFVINNPYYKHIINAREVTIEIDDFRLIEHHDEFDDAWITDDEDEKHNISYGYESGEGGNCGPI